jgi:hypothetical protein
MNSLKTWLIVVAIAVAAVIAVAAAYVLYTNPNSQSPTSSSTEFPSTAPNSSAVTPSKGGAPGAGNTFPVIGGAGDIIMTKNFKQDPSVGQYPTPGYYYIGYHMPTTGYTAGSTATDNPPYTILYIDSTQYFTISLLKEPIKQVRADAEQYLMQRLGISQDQMCRLRYTVSVPSSVSQIYSSQNLGFSFCSGAVQL